MLALALAAAGAGAAYYYYFVGLDHADHHIVISAEDLYAAMKQEDDTPIVVNVLSKETYDDAHIQGSINIPLGEIEDATHDWPKDKHIVVYCASYQCPASKEAAKQLRRAGFTRVYAYEGGTKEWLEKTTEGQFPEFPVMGPKEKSYLR